MGKNKLSKFAAMATYPNVFQYTFGTLQKESFPLKGKWRTDYFRNDNAIVLELGCGKGEYTVGLAQLFPEKNFIGIDIKGARMWSGAKQALSENLANAAFLRTHIELLHHFFAENEVSEIWITFPDPQMSKVNKRLTSTRFMNAGLTVLADTDDLYRSGINDKILNIQTFYEQQWRARGLNIRYIKFLCPQKENWTEPDIEIEKDEYRSFGRDANNLM